MILLVFLVVRWFHLCGRCREEHVVRGSSNNAENLRQQEDGDLKLSRKAKLSKRNRKERRIVLQKLFESTTFVYSTTLNKSIASDGLAELKKVAQKMVVMLRIRPIQREKYDR